MKENPNYFAILPAEVRYDNSLEPMARILYAEISSLTNKEGYCWATNKYFAELYNTSKSSVSRWVSSLNEKQHIEIHQTKGEYRQIYLKGVYSKMMRGILKNDEGYTQKCPTIYNNKYNSKLLSKDNSKFSHENSIVFKNPFVEECIQKWNNIKYTPNIRTKTRTKSIQLIEKYIEELLNGVFLGKSSNKVFNQERLKRNNIPTIVPKFEKKDVLKALDNLSLMFKEGYFPRDKAKMCRQLNQLIYNPINHNSLLLQAYYNPPSLLSKNVVKNPYKKTTELFNTKYNGQLNLDNPLQLKKFISGIKTIKDWLNNVPEHTRNKVKIFKDTSSICKEYIDFIEDDLNYDMNLSIINSTNRVWKMFIEALNKDLGGRTLQKEPEGKYVYEEKNEVTVSEEDLIHLV